MIHAQYYLLLQKYFTLRLVSSFFKSAAAFCCCLKIQTTNPKNYLPYKRQNFIVGFSGNNPI